MRKMKCIWVLMALLVAFTTGAQVRFGAKGGVNIANAKFNKDVFNSENITGFHIGPTLEAALGQGGLGLDLAVLFSQKGFGTEDKTIKNTFIDIPLNLKFKFGIPVINPFLALGPYIDFRIAGDKVWDVSFRDINQQVKTKDFGAGVNFSAGAELFNRLQLGVTYGLALTDNYESFEASRLSSYTGKSHNWSVSAVFFF